MNSITEAEEKPVPVGAVMGLLKENTTQRNNAEWALQNSQNKVRSQQSVHFETLGRLYKYEGIKIIDEALEYAKQEGVFISCESEKIGLLSVIKDYKNKAGKVSPAHYTIYNKFIELAKGDNLKPKSYKGYFLYKNYEEQFKKYINYSVAEFSKIEELFDFNKKEPEPEPEPECYNKCEIDWASFKKGDKVKMNYGCDDDYEAVITKNLRYKLTLKIHTKNRKPFDYEDIRDFDKGYVRKIEVIDDFDKKEPEPKVGCDRCGSPDINAECSEGSIIFAYCSRCAEIRYKLAETDTYFTEKWFIETGIIDVNYDEKKKKCECCKKIKVWYMRDIPKDNVKNNKYWCLPCSQGI